MKKGLLTTVFGGIALLIGLDSCKKDCVKCFTYTYNGSGGKLVRICQDELSAASYTAYRDSALLLPGFADETLCK